MNALTFIAPLAVAMTPFAGHAFAVWFWRTVTPARPVPVHPAYIRAA